MTKLEILIEIYKVQNQIKALKGKEEINLEGNMSRIEIEADNAYKADLIHQLEQVNKQLEKDKAEKDIQDRTNEYYSTEPGLSFKPMIEQSIEKKIQEWGQYEEKIIQSLERLIKRGVSTEWCVSKFYKNMVTFAVIDKEKSTDTRRVFYFGHDFTVYRETGWLSREEQLEKFVTNIASCGESDIDKKDVPENRAFFYLGLGKFLDNTMLLSNLKTILRESAEHIDRLDAELVGLRNQLADPLKLKQK